MKNLISFILHKGLANKLPKKNSNIARLKHSMLNLR